MDASQRSHKHDHEEARNSHSYSYSSGKYRRNSSKHIIRDSTTRPSSSRRTASGDSEGKGRRAIEQDGDEEGGEASTSIIGTCPFMCPERERVQRGRLRDLAVFERLDGDPATTSPSLAVKKFCRTISTKDIKASDIRPLPVLDITLKYLLELFDSSDQPFEIIHEFIFDRMRAIRQDLSMQNIVGSQVIRMYEKMVKFHVISHHQLKKCSAESPSSSAMIHLNMEQLIKCLASLYNLYDINRESDSMSENEAEFRSLHILLSLGSHGHSHTVSEPLAQWLRRLPSSLVRSKEMLFARTVVRFFRNGNFWHFFYTLSKEATNLQLLAIETCIHEVRVQALACINYSGYKLHPYPLAILSETLKMKESDLEALCRACGLETAVDDMGNKVVPSKQASFCHPKGEFSSCKLSFMDLND